MVDFNACIKETVQRNLSWDIYFEQKVQGNTVSKYSVRIDFSMF